MVCGPECSLFVLFLPLSLLLSVSPYPMGVQVPSGKRQLNRGESPDTRVW